MIDGVNACERDNYGWRVGGRQTKWENGKIVESANRVDNLTRICDALGLYYNGEILFEIKIHTVEFGHHT